MRAVLVLTLALVAGPAVAAGGVSDATCKAGRDKVVIHAVHDDFDGADGFLQVGSKKSPLRSQGTGGTGSNVLIFNSDLSEAQYHWVLLDARGFSLKINGRSIRCSE